MLINCIHKYFCLKMLFCLQQLNQLILQLNLNYKSFIMQQINITLIRHAQSLLNIASHNYRTTHNLPYIWQQLCKHKQFLTHVKYNSDFVDCIITEKGIQQCIQARNNVKEVKPDLILVSPLNRTLKTCSIVLQQYKDVKVVVQPVLAEAFRATCDISSSIQGKIQSYPNYDFSPLIKEGDYWFIKNQSQQNQQKYFQVLRKLEGKSYDQQTKELCNLMAQTMIYELPQNVRERCSKIKSMIKQKYSGQYKNICVVAHYNIIKCLMAQSFDEQHQPQGDFDVQNCQVISTTLQKLLKFN